MAAAEENLDGVQWPVAENGKVSTTEVSKRVWCACIEGMAAQEGSERVKCEALISKIKAEKDWRHKYTQYILELTTLMAGSSSSAMAQAESGLKALYEEFAFSRDGKKYNVLDAVAGKTDVPVNDIGTTKISGKGEIVNKLSVPIKVNGKYEDYEGDELIKQAEAWAKYGCCEESVGTSIAAVAHLQASELPLKNRIFCMLGGTSELCPSKPLLALGATVAAVARPGAKLDALMAYAETTAGTLLVPQLAGASKPGLDLLTHTPEVVKWLKSVATTDSGDKPQLCVGSYVYLDGEQHVRASIAMDAICTTLANDLGVQRVELAQLTSPMTSHIYPPAALEDSRKRWANRPWYAELVGLEENAGSRVGYPVKSNRVVFRGTLIPQGPNYALAKTLQLWRCVIARAQGQRISANFAPPARTASVLGGKMMPTIINGMQAFPPLIVLDVPTAASFMTAVLLSDLLPSNINPADPAVKLDHPWEMFNYNAFTGGNWRLPYHQESTYKLAYLYGLLNYESGTVALIDPSQIK
jgi:hypothetical protein